MTWITKAEAARNTGKSQTYIGRLAKQGKVDLKKGLVNLDQVQAVLNQPKASSGSEPGEFCSGYWKEKTKHEKAKRELAELEYEKRVAQVVPVEWIKKDLGKMHGAFRKRALEFSGKVAPLIKGENSPGKIKNILEAAVYEALEDMSSYEPETRK